MSWEKDLETVIERTGVERYRYLTGDQNPDVWGRTKYREMMTAQAALPGATPAQLPPVRKQAANLFRSVRGFVAGGLKLASKSLRSERLAICRQCNWFDGVRCRKCGCAAQVKVWAAAEVCPLVPPKW